MRLAKLRIVPECGSCLTSDNLLPLSPMLTDTHEPRIFEQLLHVFYRIAIILTSILALGLNPFIPESKAAWKASAIAISTVTTYLSFPFHGPKKSHLPNLKTYKVSSSLNPCF